MSFALLAVALCHCLQCSCDSMKSTVTLCRSDRVKKLNSTLAGHLLVAGGDAVELLSHCAVGAGSDSATASV